jgi:hypothetical protein
LIAIANSFGAADRRSHRDALRIPLAMLSAKDIAKHLVVPT